MYLSNSAVAKTLYMADSVRPGTHIKFPKHLKSVPEY